MSKVVVLGALGRMGSGIVRELLDDPQTELAGAVEWAGHLFFSEEQKDLDLGSLLQIGAPIGVSLTSQLSECIDSCDVIIDFSSLEGLQDNLKLAKQHGKAIVVGTTGLGDQHKEALEQASKHIACLWAPNMSVGVNLLFKLVGQVAQMLGESYNVEIIEKHHNQKKDAPSGTAVRLAEVIAQATGRSYQKDVVHGREGLVGARTVSEIGMHALRGGSIVGEHSVIYAGQAENIEIKHQAESREVFIKGAVRAAKFLAGKPAGLYSMLDVLE